MSIPVIGVTTSRAQNKAGHAYLMNMEAYIESVSRAGGAPVMIPLGLPDEQLDAVWQHLDGILFTGGGDVDPQVYGGEPHPAVGGVDADRDRVEFLLIRRAVAERRPFFGICRGIQTINVALGGTLYSDISTQLPNALPHPHDPFTERKLLPHTVRVEADSCLAEVLGSTQLPVNSLHHQGIRRLAEPLRPLAYAPDGLIEAVTLPGHPFGLAVQWHPEWLQEQAPMRALFCALVDAARKEKNAS
ncbi:MAG: gamma-glutamyl-gamma-aminobutyrate hydrolase family protein [Chloroflexota bacterium]